MDALKARDGDGGGDAELARRITGESFDRSRCDPRVQEVFTRWSRCMRARGFSYADPVAASNDPAWRTPTPSATERRAATADAVCKRQENVIGVWWTVEAVYQQREIDRHRGELADIPATSASAWPRRRWRAARDLPRSTAHPCLIGPASAGRLGRPAPPPGPVVRAAAPGRAPAPLSRVPYRRCGATRTPCGAARATGHARPVRPYRAPRPVRRSDAALRVRGARPGDGPCWRPRAWRWASATDARAGSAPARRSVPADRTKGSPHETPHRSPPQPLPSLRRPGGGALTRRAPAGPGDRRGRRARRTRRARCDPAARRRGDRDHRGQPVRAADRHRQTRCAGPTTTASTTPSPPAPPAGTAGSSPRAKASGGRSRLAACTGTTTASTRRSPASSSFGRTDWHAAARPSGCRAGQRRCGVRRRRLGAGV